MLTPADVGGLPATLGAEQTAELWGCSTWALYAMAKTQSCPVAPLRLGRKLRWPTALVLKSVGIDPDPQKASGAPSTRDAREIDPHAAKAKESPCTIPTLSAAR